MAEPSRGPRGKSFTIEQDEAICKAYLSITEDPIVGNSQPRVVFWTRVQNKYIEYTYDDQRTAKSIKSRWQTIQKACSKFRGCLRSIQALNQSGMTEQNEIDQAKRAFYDDSDGKYFTGMDGCWKILEHSIKWQDVVPGGRKPRAPQTASSSGPQSPDGIEIPSTYPSLDTDNTPSSGGTGSVSSPSKRKQPIGRKLAKEKKAKSKQDEIHDAKFINLMEQFNQSVIDKEARKAQLEERRVASLEKQTAIEERKAEMHEKEMEEKMMQTNLDLVEDPQLKAYYQHRKRQIMEKLTGSSSTDYYQDFPDY